MKKIVLIGGSGTIGSILREGFASEFELVNLDIEVNKKIRLIVKWMRQNMMNLFVVFQMTRMS